MSINISTYCVIGINVIFLFVCRTDKLIQQTIRTKFTRCTVLTIAHRLHTVMDSDRILVMDSGAAVELGHPFELLRNNGYLTKLAEQTGKSTYDTFMKTAEQCYYNKK